MPSDGRDAAGWLYELPRSEREEAVARLRAASPGHRPEPGLGEARIHQLVAAGAEIGFHTADHEPLPTLGDDQLAGAMVQGARTVEAAAKARLLLLAYPYGEVDARTAAAAGAAGYQAAF